MGEKSYTLSRKAQSRLRREGYAKSGVRGPIRGEYMDNIKDKGERNAEARSANDYRRGGSDVAFGFCHLRGSLQTKART
jgi:hypothetical protein